MHDASPTISLPAVFALLRRHLGLILLTIGIAIGVSLVISASTESTYTADATVGFNDNSAELQALGVPAAPSFQPDKEAAAQAERVTRPDVVARVRKQLDLDLSVAEIQDAIATRVEVASNLVSITAEASTGFLAAQLANAFANAIEDDATSRTVDRYEAAAREARRRARRLRGTANAGRRAVFEEQSARLLALASFAQPVEIVRSAEIPEDPSSPRPVRSAILAGILGGMLGIGLTFLRQAFDRRLREPSDVEQHVDAPVIGFVRTSSLGRTPFVEDAKHRTPDEDVEAFRILRPNIGFLHRAEDSGAAKQSGANIVLVTSPLPQEGKSTVAAGLAWAEAMTGRRTLLVDCDLRRPTIASRLGIEASPGLADYLSGDVDPTATLRTVSTGKRSGREGPSLVVIPAGRQVPDHAELLESERFRLFLEQVGDVYDSIILDSAPLLPVSDTLHLLPHVGVVLMCVRLGQTTRDDAQAARAALSRFPSLSIGIVVTAADTSRSPYYAGAYSYEARPDEQA